MGTRTRIIIADDHELVRNALTRIFNSVADMKVVAEARDAEEVFRHLDEQKADVMVLDLNMPGKDGLEILRQLKTTKNDVPVVILTFSPHEKFRREAMRLGAAEFLTKDCQPDELIDAVRNAKNRAA